MISFVLMVLATLISTATNCFWSASVTSVTHPFTPVHLSIADVGVYNVQQQLQELDVKNLYAAKENYSSSSHFVLASVECETKEESSMKARHLSSISGGAEVILYFPPEAFDGSYASPKVFTFVGAVIESEGESECKEGGCPLVWLVPFPFHGQHLKVEVEVRTIGGSNGIIDKRYVITLDSFGDSKNTVSPLSVLGEYRKNSLGDVQYNSCQRVTLHQAKPLSSSISFFLNSSSLIYTYNNFEDFINVMVNLNDRNSQCDKFFPEQQTVSLPDRVILVTSDGVSEVFGMLTDVDSIEENYLHKADVSFCPWKVAVGHHTSYSQKFIYIIDSEQCIFRAEVKHGQRLQFEISSDTSICNFVIELLVDVSSCSVVDVAVSGCTSSKLILLVKTTSESSSLLYHLASFDGLSGEFQLISNQSCALSNLSCSENRGIYSRYFKPTVLTSISSLAFPSSKIFIWGSHLIYSPDGGETLYNQENYKSCEIVLFSSSSDGQFAFQNDCDEIWYGFAGSAVSITKLHPSYGFTMEQSLNARIFPKMKTLSLFFDEQEHLRKLQLTEDANGSLSLSSEVINVAAIINTNQPFLPPLSAQCPFQGIHIDTSPNQKADRSLRIPFSAPLLTKSGPHKLDSLLVYQSVVQKAMDFITLGKYQRYSGPTFNPSWQMLLRMETLANYHDYLYRNKLLRDGIHVPKETFQIHDTKLQDFPANSLKLPKTIFLDKGEQYTFEVHMTGRHKTALGVSTLSNLHMSVDVSETDLVDVHVQRNQHLVHNLVTYEITVKDKKNMKHQSPPGKFVHVVKFLMEAWNSALKCYTYDEMTGMKLEGLKTMDVILGCPPDRKLLFDIRTTMNKSLQNPLYDCPNPEPDMPCMYFKSNSCLVPMQTASGNYLVLKCSGKMNFIYLGWIAPNQRIVPIGFLVFEPVFEVIDITTGQTEPFTGRYTLNVIGGKTANHEDFTMFVDEELARYNLQASTKHGALIWQPNDTKVIQPAGPQFSRDNNAIIWLCEQFSPCADVPQSFPYSPEYYLLIEVSNKGMEDLDTYCEYQVQFVVKIHGLPISAFRSIRIVIWSLIIFTILVLLFLACDWNERKIWKKFVLRMKGGFKIHPEPQDSIIWGATQPDAGGSGDMLPSDEEVCEDSDSLSNTARTESSHSPSQTSVRQRGFHPLPGT